MRIGLDRRAILIIIELFKNEQSSFGGNGHGKFPDCGQTPHARQALHGRVQRRHAAAEPGIRNPADGGGDSAVEEAMYLTKFARKVTIIHRRNELRAAKSIQEKAFRNDKIEFMWDSVVEEVGGDDILQWMKVKNVKTGEVTTVEADEEDGMFGVFGFIGTIPNSKPFEGIIDMDERGYIKTDDDMHTNIPGVYAAGDVRIKSLRQVVTAAADGAIAAVQVERSMSDYF